LLTKEDFTWDNKTGGIYQIKNMINNKVYIGSTKYFYGRFKRHENNLLLNKHDNSHLQRAWNKYGENNFEFNVIEIVDNEDDLLNREQFWIDNFNSSNSDYGYNILPFAGRTSGVKRTESTKIKLSIAKIGNKNPMYQKEVSQETRQRISKSLINMPEDKKKEMLRKRGEKISISQIGRRLSNETKQKMRDKKLGNILSETQKLKIKVANSIKIVQVDLQGNLIKKWNSMIDVQRELGYDTGAISKCCNKINKTYKNNLWFFADEYYSDEFNIKLFINRPRRENSIQCAVLQIDKDSNEIINKWDNIDDAVKTLDLDKYALLRCCRGKYKTHKNYIWEFVN
jgi:group I intron endonuclease